MREKGGPRDGDLHPSPLPPPPPLTSATSFSSTPNPPPPHHHLLPPPRAPLASAATSTLTAASPGPSPPISPPPHTPSSSPPQTPPSTSSPSSPPSTTTTSPAKPSPSSKPPNPPSSTPPSSHLPHLLLLLPPQNLHLVGARRLRRRLGNHIPIVLALSLVNHLDLGTTLIFTAIYNALTGLLFGIPMLVQPMKSIAAVAIVESSAHLTVPQIMAADISTASVLFLLDATGLMSFFYRFIPLPVVRGIQLSQASPLPSPPSSTSRGSGGEKKEGEGKKEPQVRRNVGGRGEKKEREGKK